MKESEIWKIIEVFFRDSPNYLLKHHIESYEKFCKKDIYNILIKHNPINIHTKDKKVNCNLYIGGKNGDKLYFDKPIVYDEKGSEHFMFPNEARLLNLTYAMNIHYDIEVELIHYLNDDEELSLEGNEFNKQLIDGNLELLYNNQSENTKRSPIIDVNQFETTPKIAEKIQNEKKESVIVDKNGQRIQKYVHLIENIFLCNFPIMVQSEFCILQGLPRENRFMMGECKNDLGGYFIINGKEKYFTPTEKIAGDVLITKQYDSKKSEKMNKPFSKKNKEEGEGEEEGGEEEYW